jgi:hypothetical protein
MNKKIETVIGFAIEGQQQIYRTEKEARLFFAKNKLYELYRVKIINPISPTFLDVEFIIEHSKEIRDLLNVVLDEDSK